MTNARTVFSAKLASSVIFFVSIISLPAFAQPPAPSMHALAAAAKSAQAARCATDECSALILVHQLISLITNGSARTYGLSPSETDKIDLQTGQQVDTILFAQPKEFPAECKILTGMVAQFPPGDFPVAIASIELALRMDMKSGSCLPQVLHAFRPSSYAMIAVNNAHELCEIDWKLGSACTRIGGFYPIDGSMMIPPSVSSLNAEAGVFVMGTLRNSSDITFIDFRYSRNFSSSQARYAKITCSGKELSSTLPADISLSCSDGLDGDESLTLQACDKDGDYYGWGVITLAENITGSFTFPQPTSPRCPPIRVK